MFHKTVKSFYDNTPMVEEGEHPDGPLWPITTEEILEMPKGTRLETDKGEIVIVGKHVIFEEVNYGIRGYR